MKHQNATYEGSERDEMLHEEATAHDEFYETDYPYPFLSGSYGIDLDAVRYRSDHCYKPGRFVAGYRRKRLFELIDLGTLEGKTVLDVGCGNGQFSVLFALYGAEVYGFDISEVGIEISRETARANDVADSTHFSVQSADSLTYPDGTFDVVVCNAVLHHLLKYDGVEDELYRVLSDDGRLVFADGVRDNPLYNLGRRMYRAIGGSEASGDVDIENEDYRDFVERYDEVHVERFTLLYGVKELCKQTIGQEDYPLPVRAGLYAAKKIDDVLLHVPGMEDYTLDIVGTVEKG